MIALITLSVSQMSGASRCVQFQTGLGAAVDAPHRLVLELCVLAVEVQDEPIVDLAQRVHHRPDPPVVDGTVAREDRLLAPLPGEVDLERRDAEALDRLGQLVPLTLGEQLQMERRVDVRVRLEGLDQPGYDVEVGLGVLEVVDQRGHAADRGERGARRGVDLERLVAAEVDVGVDGAGQHVQASGVEPIAALERGPGCVQAGDAAVDDGDVERARVAARRDDSASLDDEIRGHERSLRSR